MTRRFLVLLALALPVLGLAASAAWHSWRQSGAVEWRIPVSGYDPRDPLAGHYARFRFAWQAQGRCLDGRCVFCLEDGKGTVIARVEPEAARCANRVDPAASGIDVLWPAAGSGEMPTANGRIYIGESEVPRITRLLARNEGVLLIARLINGRLVAERLEPAP